MVFFKGIRSPVLVDFAGFGLTEGQAGQMRDQGQGRAPQGEPTGPHRCRDPASVTLASWAGPERSPAHPKERDSRGGRGQAGHGEAFRGLRWFRISGTAAHPDLGYGGHVWSPLHPLRELGAWSTCSPLLAHAEPSLMPSRESRAQGS